VGPPTHAPPGPPRRLAAQGGKGELCTALITAAITTNTSQLLDIGCYWIAAADDQHKNTAKPQIG
jgi:hypothetical protein